MSRRLVLRALLITIGLIAIGMMAIYAWMRSSLPDYDGKLQIAGLIKPVKMVRDAHAVPHIFAENEADAYFALGYAHAQDRLWQLDMNRRIASGRIAEIAGAAALPTDIFLRTLGLSAAAAKAYDGLDDKTRRLLQHYAAGVNAYIKNHKGAWPPEFLILKLRPEPWRPVDSLAWLKMMAWDLSMNWRDELARLTLLNRLTPEQVGDFFPAYPGTAPFELPSLETAYPGLKFQTPAGPKQAMLDPNPPALGSNNWVVSGALTASGKPLLANDPHLDLGAPSVWYLAHISAPGHDMIGATLPGAPFVVLGRNDHIAWGFTNTGSDVEDVYIERLAPDMPNSYMTATGPLPFQTREEKIFVRGGDDKIITIRETRHGPVISDALPELAALIDENHVMSLRWTALDANDSTAESGRILAEARNWQGFLDAARLFAAPQQNIVYADRSGNIGFIAPARVPIRAPESLTKGLIPARGWMAEDEWRDWIPFSDLPKRFNPDTDMIVTANQKIVGPDYLYALTRDWALPYRADRIEQRLKEGQKHDIETMKAIQNDPISPMAAELKKIMLEMGQFGTDYKDARGALAAWDGGMWRDRPEPLIYMAWHRAFTKLLYADELGDLFPRYWALRPAFVKKVLTQAKVSARWCDDATTQTVEYCPQLIARAFDLAMEELKKDYGADWRDWRWGDAHRVKQTHRPLSDAPGIARFFEISFPADGGPYAINVGNAHFSAIKPYESTHAPSYRAIYDLAKPDASLYVIPSGQSGNPLSAHYDDMASLWRDGEYIRIPADKNWIEQNGAGILELLPAPEK